MFVRWRKHLVVVASTVVLLAAVATPAFAASSDAPLSDGQDTPGSTIDIKSTSVSSNGTDLTLTIETWAAFDETDTDFTWVLDTNVDGLADYAILATYTGSLDAFVLTFRDHRGDESGATVVKSSPTAVQITVPRSLVGATGPFDYLVASDHDSNGNGEIEEPEEDVVPDVPPFGFPDPVVRLAGANRITTAIAISSDVFGDGQAESAVLSRDDQFADALGGTPLAVQKNGPLLLTPTSGLRDDVRAELTRVLPRGATVYLLGGTGALSQGVADAVAGLGYQVVRFAGGDRFETAIRVAEDGLGNPDSLFLTTGLGFADALAAGAAAASRAGAVLLTAGATMPTSVGAYLQAHGSAARFAIGGPAAAADPAATAVVGADRYETSRRTAEAFFQEPDVIGVASGRNFADALAGGAHIGTLGGPLVLSDPATVPDTVRDYVTSNRTTIAEVIGYGGAVALSDDVLAELRSALAQ